VIRQRAAGALGDAPCAADGLGIHVTARCRHFRDAVEAMEASEIDHALSGLLAAQQAGSDVFSWMNHLDRLSVYKSTSSICLFDVIGSLTHGGGEFSISWCCSAA